MEDAKVKTEEEDVAPAPSSPAKESESKLEDVAQVEEQQPMPKVDLCDVCETAPSRYKCPRPQCYLRYCSVTCNKKHRENHPPDPTPEPTPEVKRNALKPAPKSHPDPNNPFRALDGSDKLQILFTKYPRLPDQLLQIFNATQPPQDTETRGIPASLLQGLPQNKKNLWSPDLGIRKGKQALRRARKASGEDGEAIREYTELVLYLLNEDERKEELARVLREQAAQDDTQHIEQLMDQEKHWQ